MRTESTEKPVMPCKPATDRQLAVIDRLAAGERVMSWQVHPTTLLALHRRRMAHVTPGCALHLGPGPKGPHP